MKCLSSNLYNKPYWDIRDDFTERINEESRWFLEEVELGDSVCFSYLYRDFINNNFGA